jgi:hypothetical protein
MFSFLTWKSILAVVAIAVGLLVVRSWWKGRGGGVALEGFQAAAAAAANIPTEVLQQTMDPCAMLKSLHTNLITQIQNGEGGKIPPSQLELLKISKGSIEQQMAATNCA